MKSAKESFRIVKSIRTRLMLLYTSAAFIMCVLLAVFFYAGLLNLLYKSDYQFLRDEVDATQFILVDSPLDMDTLRHMVTVQPTETKQSIYRYYIRVTGIDSSLSLETPGMKDIVSADAYLHEVTTNIKRPHYIWHSAAGNHYLLIQAKVKRPANKSEVMVQVVLDVSYQHALIHDTRKLIFALLVASMCSLLLGFFMTNRGMRSLYLLLDTVKRITATSLSERIDPKSWPVELTAIGSSFNKMLDRMESSFSRLKHFSEDLSHELRTPVSNLIGQTEIALSYEDSVLAYRQVMESNLEELQKMSSMIENILFLARAENPQIDLHLSKLDVKKEMDVICEYYQAMADEKNISLSCEGDATLQANEVMFRRLFSNLISNALKSTPVNGCIRIKIKTTLQRQVQIKVIDNGVGVAAQHIPHLFDRFYRVLSSVMPSQGGHGLGLAIVKSIVDLHGGTISVTSEEGAGTTFLLVF